MFEPPGRPCGLVCHQDPTTASTSHAQPSGPGRHCTSCNLPNEVSRRTGRRAEAAAATAAFSPCVTEPDLEIQWLFYDLPCHGRTPRWRGFDFRICVSGSQFRSCGCAVFAAVGSLTSSIALHERCLHYSCLHMCNVPEKRRISFSGTQTMT